MVPLAIVGIILAFLAVEIAIQFIEHRRGGEVYGFFMPDPIGEASHLPANYARMVDCLRDFGIAPPKNAFLHRGHSWAAIAESGEAEIGLDAFARKAIGRVDEVELPAMGRSVRQGEKLFAVRQGSRVAEFVAPIDGIVSSVNDTLSRRRDLDSSGWVCKVRPSNLSANLKVLKVAEEAVRWIYDELFRLQELVAAQMPRLQTVGVTMQDGALALDNLLETLDDEAWKLFRERFLENS